MRWKKMKNYLKKNKINLKNIKQVKRILNKMIMKKKKKIFDKKIEEFKKNDK